MAIKISDVEKHKNLTEKIFKAQIILDDLKKMAKTGQKNIKILREERRELETHYHRGVKNG